MTKLTLNKTAIAQFDGAPKARIRNVGGGVIQLRPTNRVSGKRLPKGEVLVDIKRGGIFNTIDLQAAFGETGPDVFTSALLAPAKHGWLSLVDAGDSKPTVKAG